MYTKTSLRWFLSLLLTITLFSGNFLSAKAQPSRASDVISFTAMGKEDTALTGPIDSQEIFFRLPADWTMLSDSVLHLNLNAATGMTPEVDHGVAGFFEVYMNDTWLATVNLTTDGEYSVDVIIPPSAWITTTKNAPQVLRFTLMDALRCEMWLAAATTGGYARGISTVVRSTSYIDFTHGNVPAPTDLKFFPYPIFQDTFKPDKAVVVIPNQPTQGEMQAAMTLSAAFGRLTDGRLNLQLITVSQLTDNTIKESNLIFVGSPAAFPQLDSAKLPAPFNESGFDNVQMSAEDGILQMITAPQNPSKVWLLVSGTTDAAIMKAAQAAGGNQIRPYGPDNLAVVTAIGENVPEPYKIDFTFADLGYPAEQTYSGDYNDLGIWFEMPANELPSDGAYFEMVFTNSAVLNFDESSVKVMVNDSLVGGLRFSDRTTSITRWKFNIPPALLHPGRNLLLLELYLSGSSACVPYDELWFTIMPESLLHLPTTAIPENTVRNYDLTKYPTSVFSTFEQTAFVLPKGDPTAWSIASKIAFDLGKKLGGSPINVASYYGDDVPDDVKKSMELILVGRPSAMPVISQFSEVMPASFENGQDIAVEKDPQYSYLVTASVPVGYIQVFSSPWDSKLAVLAVSGNMDEGLDAASTALLTPSIRGRLTGNLIVVLDDKIIVRQVNLAASSQTSPEIVVAGNQQSTASGQTGKTSKINISLPLIVMIIAFILAGAGVVILLIINRQERRVRKVGVMNKQESSETKDAP